jgi:hypothetical protein
MKKKNTREKQAYFRKNANGVRLQSKMSEKRHDKTATSKTKRALR